MKKLLALISDSYHEFKHVSTITTCAMFGAMSIVLNQLATIRVTPNLKIGFGALPNELVDYLFGPVVGSLFGGGMDIIKFMLKPDGGFLCLASPSTPCWLPLFTVSSFIRSPEP